MTKSLEALEKLLELATLENGYALCCFAEDYCKTIKQDLERLERLEEANILLTQKSQNEINYAINEISKLKQENQELKEEKLYYKNKYLDLYNSYQNCEDLKRKKAIEILKPILDIYTGDGKGYIDCCVENPIITFDLHNDKELKEFYLLKEVFGNE